MNIKKFEDINISWDVEEIDKLIGYYEGQRDDAETEQETSDFPEGEEQTINKSEACISLLRDMKNVKSWSYRFAHK